MGRPRQVSLFFALAVAPLIASLVSTAASAATGCLEEPRAAVLDRLAGVWEVTSDDGAAEGRAQVRSVLGGCAFEVVRQEAGVDVARALVYRDPVSDRWVERWVSIQGATARLEIEVVGEGLRLNGAMHDPEGAATPVRLEVEPGPGEDYTHRLYLSLDGGATWEQPQVSIYRRQDAADSGAEAAEAAPAAEVTVVPEPASPPPSRTVVEAPPEPPRAEVAEETQPAAVTVRSERSRYQPPASTVRLESPMLLEVELGPVDALPEGTAWRTTETAVYLVDEVRMPQVSASRRERRGKVELEVTVNLRTPAMQRRVDVAVELLDEGVSVGRESAENLALGKLIGSHDPRVGRPTTLRFAFDEEKFEALFADGKRPVARITVTVK